jgi:hypothetical protein
MRIYLPILAAVLALCLCFGPFRLPSENGAVMQPPLAPDALRNIYHAAGAREENDNAPTAPPTTAPATAPAIAETDPAQ